MRNIFAIFAAVFFLGGCSLATPDKSRCDSCLDGGTDAVLPDMKPVPKTDAKPEAEPDAKKPDLPKTCVDNDKDGYCLDVDCNDDNPNIHPNALEVCNGVDDNCDGNPDNNPVDVGAPCGSSVGECKPGKEACVNGGLVCTGAVLPKNEICDGKDNNCDGKVDEDFADLGKVCEVGVGECKRSGYYECNGSATKLKCSAEPAVPQMEGPPGSASCNDGKDNNCDGLTDADDPDCKVGGCATDAECNDNDLCTFDKCLGGVCKHDSLPDNTLCSDGKACNGIEKCKSGKCEPGVKLTCDDGNQCTQDSCDETVQGYCVHKLIAASAKEGLPGSSECLDGQDNDCDGPIDLQDPDCVGCKNDLECAGANPDPCVNYVCNAKMVCENSPKSIGASCNSGTAKFCNGPETCKLDTDNLLKCTAGTVKVCNDNDACTIDSCSEALQGKCVYTPISGCKSCVVASDCDDGNDCTLDECKSGKCSNTAKPDNTACDDGAFCTVNDKCLGGACMGTPRDCSAFANACNLASCNEQFDICEQKPKANGTSCSDGLYCNGNETCQSGTCQAGAVPVCNDNNACTNDVCDPIQDKCVFNLKNLSGLESWTVSGSCGDGIDNDCDGLADYADPDCRQCQNDNDCAASIGQCKKAVCNLVTYKCETQNLTGTYCDDSQWCTTGDICNNGVCSGVARDCSVYGDTCNAGTCNESLDICQKSPKPDNTVCDDGQWCTVNDHCSSGTCVSGGARSCGTGYICNESTDQCQYRQCQTNSDCNDNNQCTTDICNTSTWTCEHQNANGNPCDDGLWCTIGDYCVNGYCQGGGARNCNPGTCNEYTDTCDNNQTGGPGCTDGTREGFLDSSVFPNIAGCSGGWSLPGLTMALSGTPYYGCGASGNSSSNPNGYNCNAANLCAVGWHICTGAQDVSSRLPYGKSCYDAWSGSDKRFFATRQSSLGNGYCNTSGMNDIYGCGNFGDPPQPVSCGTLNVFSSEDCLAIAKIPGTSTLIWDCAASGDTQNELELVKKYGPDLGGVLCCRN